MAIAQYLAMTAAEMAASHPLPERAAWMACHFSPYSTGLCNLPARLPAGSLLILNDRIPIRGHDAARVCEELRRAIGSFGCTGLLVDFQNPPTAEALSLTAYLSAHLGFPMAVPPEYHRGNTAVFVPAVPSLTRLSSALSPWDGQEIWLELSLAGQAVTLRRSGASFENNFSPVPGIVHAEAALHCHYVIEAAQDSVVFRTWRTAEDLAALVTEAGQAGVTRTVGLYQELGPLNLP